MQRSCLIIFILLYGLSLKAQLNSNAEERKNPNSRYVGKYELEGTIIQFGLKGKGLVLIVPGTPIQKLTSAGKNRFISTVFKDQTFVFVEDKAKIIGVISQESRGTFKGKKITEKIEIWSMAMDSLIPKRKSTEHFLFMHNAIDSVSIDSISMDMEKSHKKILADFNLKKIPNVTVRIYPDLESFHKGINFPNAPNQLLATAFGKDHSNGFSP